MDGYDTFLTYQALKLHLTNKSYDYFKYKKTYSCPKVTFEKRRDRFIFHKLGRKYKDLDELEFFLAANFFMNPKAWVGMLTTDEAQTIYFQRRKIKESLEYTVIEDLRLHKIDTLDEFQASLVVKDGDYPRLLLLDMQKEIHPETLIAVNTLTACMETWDKKVSDTIIYPALALRYRRYAPFLSIDQKKLSSAVRSFLTAK